MLSRILILLFTATSLSSCQLIEDQLDGNQTPVVNNLTAEPAEGEAPLLVGFSWDVTDIEGDSLSCTLVYGDKRQQVDDCGAVTNTFATFEEPGGYTVVLKIEDGVNRAARSTMLRILEPESK